MDTAREAFGPQGSTQNPEPSADGHMDARDEGLGAAAEFGLVAKWSREVRLRLHSRPHNRRVVRHPDEGRAGMG
jgi:hypothetical protein